MRTLFALGLLSAGLLGATPALAQCDTLSVTNAVMGSWKVNNAYGQGFGGLFIGKPQVEITGLYDGRLWIDGEGPYPIETAFGPQPNPNGGFWCAFVIGGEEARIGQASNKWWILEIGTHTDRNKIELIRR